MKNHLVLFIGLLFLALTSCREKERVTVFIPVDWQQRSAILNENDSLHTGSTYLSVYSEIYEMNERTTHQLTATVSIRNISLMDTVYITKADYYNTDGDIIRSYIDRPVFVKPLETLEIIIYKSDTSGGSGANFIFDWVAGIKGMEPHFEAVMVWTTGHQGISFVTHGVKRQKK